MSAIRDIFLLSKIVQQKNNSNTDENQTYSSEEDFDSDDFDSDDVVTLCVLQREKALEIGEAKLQQDRLLLAKSIEKIEKQKATFEKKIALLKTEFEKEKASVEKIRKELAKKKKVQSVSNAQRVEFLRQKKEYERSVRDYNELNKNFKKEKAEFDAQKAAHTTMVNKMQSEILFHKKESLKRKREADSLDMVSKRALAQKRRAISDIERVLSQLKGEKYWSYACPSQLRGTDAALWSKYKCKRLVNGQEYSSDVLRGPKGETPRWRNLTEVVNVLCSKVV